MGLPAEARMAVLSELAFGVAHTLNNALTAIGGEASFLQGECKDPQVEEACGVILEQVERCARLTHALLRRRGAPAAGPRECELGRVLGDVEALLRDALPRRLTLAIERGEEPALLALSPDDAETLVLLLVQRAAFRIPGAAALTLGSARQGERVRLELRARAERELAPGGVEAPPERLLQGAVDGLAGSLRFTTQGNEERVEVTLPGLSTRRD